MAGLTSACIDLAGESVDLPDMGCDVGADAYRRKLKLLLRVGDLWDVPAGGVFDRLLLALAEEYARFHLGVCELAEDAPYAVGPLHDWRLATYEKLLAAYGIDAVVSDHQCNILTTDNMDADSRVWDERFVYFIIITVPRLADIPDDHPVHACLNAYRQSHTAFMWRQHPTWTTAYEIERLTVDNMHADSLVYEQCFHGLTIHAHPTFKPHEMYHYFESPLDVRRDLVCHRGSITETSNTFIPRLTVDNMHADSLIYERDFHAVTVTGPETTDLPAAFTEHREFFDYREWTEAGNVTVQTDYDIPRLTVDNMHADSLVYERDFHAVTVTAPNGYSLNAARQHKKLLGIRANTAIRLIHPDTNTNSSYHTHVIYENHSNTGVYDTLIKYEWEPLPHGPY